MRVAHLTTVDSSLRFLLWPQLRASIERGHEVIGISSPGPWVAGLERDGVRHIALPSSTRGMDLRADIRAGAELWRILRREHIDVLHTHNPKPGIYGRPLGRLAGVPIVVNTNHGLYATEDDRLAKRLVVYSLEGFASRFSDAELIQNPEDLSLLTRWHLVRKGRARLLGNGIDLARFRPGVLNDEERGALRAELGAGDDTVVVGTVGRLVAEKGYAELFTAAGLLPQGYRVVAIGPDDPEKADALAPGEIDRARRNGVCLLGHRSDVDRLYAAMDIFVLASHREGFPRAAMEAAASGLPLVVTDIRGCREVVEHGVNGLRVPLRDPNALAEAIRRVGSDSEMRSKMGEASVRRALERFDESQIVDIVVGCYEAAREREPESPAQRRLISGLKWQRRRSDDG